VGYRECALYLMKSEFQYLEAAEFTDSWAVTNEANHELVHILKILSELLPIHVVSYKAGTFLIGL
jgi:hypothetical protein